MDSIAKDLVLIGGGHSHAIVLLLFGMKPMPGVRLTLITDTSHTPYSGMLPGHVAGFYSYDETHIDLRRLASFAGVQYILDRAIGLDLANNKVICANRPPVMFDYLSIDIGSTPSIIDVPGAREYAIAAKPVPQFLQAWNEVVVAVKNNPKKPITLSIVGGGAGGVELALNMQAHLQQFYRNNRLLNIHLFHSSDRLLPGHNQWVSKHLENILLKRGIKLHLQEKVSQVFGDRVICESGLTIECDRLFWVTQASSPDWIKSSGLITDANGFILVKDTLQSISHDRIFAAGDIATMQNYQRPKAGVFAVRQGKPLFKNLQSILLGKKLKPYIPQKYYLSLIGTGDKCAIASWSFLGFHSHLLWLWKDRIDRQFMNRFSNLPKMSVVVGAGLPRPYKSVVSSNRATNEEVMYCTGCAAKIGSTVLQKVLNKIEIFENKDILIGLNQPDDAAVVSVPQGQLMVHTIDYFPSLISDPFIFGQIATNHCLSDLFAMGATPQNALAIATIPHAIEDKLEETLYQLLSGANKVLKECQTALVGGHTIEGTELAFGLACNGLVSAERILTKQGMKPGQVLILTKAIGTGTIFAAQMRTLATGRWIDNAIESMLISNRSAAQILLDFGVTACTDVTGFGLLGHLIEMLESSDVSVELNLEAIPILTGAIETIQMGITSSLQPQNLKASCYIRNSSEVSHLPKYQLLFDPQTSGGLLGSIDSEKAEECISKLKEVGYLDSCIIGSIQPATEINLIRISRF